MGEPLTCNLEDSIMPTIEEIFAMLATLAEDPETAKTIADVATGEGGVTKIEKVGSDLLTLAGHVQAALAAAPPKPAAG